MNNFIGHTILDFGAEIKELLKNLPSKNLASFLTIHTATRLIVSFFQDK